jgi:hypothetical protein
LTWNASRGSHNLECEISDKLGHSNGTVYIPSKSSKTMECTDIILCCATIQVHVLKRNAIMWGLEIGPSPRLYFTHTAQKSMFEVIILESKIILEQTL